VTNSLEAFSNLYSCQFQPNQNVVRYVYLLINEDDTIWFSANVFRKLSSRIVTNISGRSTNQS
jgi:hypothetical protein